MTYASEQVADTLTSRWRFEETSGTTIADDIAARNGTVTATLTLDAGSVLPGASKSADFTGGYVTFGTASGLLSIGTVEVVCTFDSAPVGANSPTLFTHAWAGGQIIPLTIGWNLDTLTPGKLQLGYFTGAVWVTTTWAAGPVLGQPYHLVGTYDGITLKLYANNVLVSSFTVVTTRPLSGTLNANGYIGRHWTNVVVHDGKIADVAIYAGALSAIRIAAHYVAAATTFDNAFASAGLIQLSAQYAGMDTTGWTTEGSEPSSAGVHSGWAYYDVTRSGVYQFDTIGSNYDTKLAVYTGVSLGTLVLQGSDDNSGGSNTSKLTLALLAGTRYYVQLGSGAGGGAGGAASFLLSLITYASAVIAVTAVPLAHPAAHPSGNAVAGMAGTAAFWVYKGHGSKTTDTTGAA